jgi:hypothetical protein
LQRIALNHFECLEDIGSGQRKILDEGRTILPSFRFYIDEILNNKTDSYKTKDYVEDIPQSLKEEAFQIIDEFHASPTEYKLRGTSYKNNDNILLSILQNVLNNNYYIAIGVFLGHNIFSNKFHAYNKDAKRPALKRFDLDTHTDTDIEKDSSHAMTIIDYYTYQGDVLFLIKNSWGNDWGVNGTILLKWSELKKMHPHFAWLQPNDMSTKSIDGDREIRNYSPENDEIIDETEPSEYRSNIYDILVGKEGDSEPVALKWRRICSMFYNSSLTDEQCEDHIRIMLEQNNLFIYEYDVPLVTGYMFAEFVTKEKFVNKEFNMKDIPIVEKIFDSIDLSLNDDETDSTNGNSSDLIQK